MAEKSSVAATSAIAVTQVEKYSLSDVKPVLDDNLRLILVNIYSYKEDHTHSNVKLLLGLVSSIVAGVVAYYCWVTPFKETRYWTIAGVIGYFFLNSLYVLYVMMVEKSQIFVGNRKSDKKEVAISTELRNYDPTYRVRFKLSNGIVLTEQQSINAWLDNSGRFVQSEFSASVARWLLKHRLN